MSFAAKWFRLGVAVIAAGVAFLGAPAMPAAQDLREVRVEASQAKLVELGASAATVFVADPAIADVQTPTSTQIIVYGKTPGRTTVMALGEGRRLVANLSVTVDYPVSDMMRMIERELPRADVRLSSTPRGVVAAGTVPDPASGQLVASVVARYLNKGDKFIDNMQVQTLVQVALKIRIAEVSRAAMEDLGVHWGAILDDGSFAIGLATGRGPVNSDIYNANVVLDALVRDGNATILAEPTLSAMSGQSARFLSGGEFPIPVVRETSDGRSATAVEFKKFGVALDFAPTVLSPERISLRVKPEVSELSSANSVKIDGSRIPGITIRTAETTIELGSGQTFAIAGLFQDATISNVDALPGLSDIPILGALFRSDRFRRRESELVILVTPYLARPVSERSAAMPSVDHLTLRRQTKVMPEERPRAKAPSGNLSPVGEAGFVVE